MDHIKTGGWWNLEGECSLTTPALGDQLLGLCLVYWGGGGWKSTAKT